MPAKREHPKSSAEAQAPEAPPPRKAARGQGAEDFAAGKGARTRAASQRAAAQAAIDAITVRSERRSPHGKEAAAAVAAPKKHAPDTAAPVTPTAPSQASGRHVSINRAPVLTLWVAAVAQREGRSWEAGLTFGREISGLLAQSKGRSLGIYEKKERTEEAREARRQRDREAGVERAEVFGMHIPVVKVGGEARGASEGRPVDPAAVDGYLRRAFGPALPAVKEAMEALAGAVPKGDIGRVAYKLYERFRPAWHGWGAKGDLDLQQLRELAAGAWRESL